MLGTVELHKLCKLVVAASYSLADEIFFAKQFLCFFPIRWKHSDR